MITKSVERLIIKLKQKKHRYADKLFVAEGEKTIEELLREGLAPKHLLVNDLRFKKVPNRISIGKELFKKLSSLDAADGTLAVFPFPEFYKDTNDALVLILDNVKIPGNLGTIIRTADWFNVTQIYCTIGTTDAYNSKCVQSSMGSIGRVQVTYASEIEISENLKNHTFYCADIQGVNLKDVKPLTDTKVALIMGSESHGPSDFWKAKAETVTISRKGKSKTESLNVAIATAICLQHFA